MSDEIDLRAAINAISDVIQNRPRPLRKFDQIHMKAADMVMQSELVAKWADGKRLAFIGDGDAISVCVAYLQKRGILSYGPSKIGLFDFDERICNAVTRFADRERLEQLGAELYNCLDALPDCQKYDCFYTNPPWGGSNAGQSVNVFVQRGMEAIGYQGEGLVVIADGTEFQWAPEVLANVQRFALNSHFFVQKMATRMHQYHLDDNPSLRSCNLLLKSLSAAKVPGPSVAITEAARLEHFYGRDQAPTVRYVRERAMLDYGKAHDDEYSFEFFEAQK